MIAIILCFFAAAALVFLLIEWGYSSNGRAFQSRKSITDHLDEASSQYSLLRIAASATTEEDLFNLDRKQDEFFQHIQSLPKGSQRAACGRVLLENMTDVIYAKNRVRGGPLTPSEKRIISRSHMPPTELYRYIR